MVTKYISNKRTLQMKTAHKTVEITISKYQ